jgi:hypothetical protein
VKLVNDVLVKLKGKENVDKTIHGKGAYSQKGFEDLFHVLVNDTTYEVSKIDKDGKEVKYNLSSPIRESVKKTSANAKYPQKSEISVFDTCEIDTKEWVDCFKHAVDKWMSCGRKFDLLTKDDRNGSIYLVKVPPKKKVVNVHDIKTKENLGTTTISSEEYTQVRVKSHVPKHLQTKVRRDVNGKIVTK